MSTPKIEKMSSWDRERWDEISLSDYIGERIDPEPERGYGYERLGELEKIQQSVERVKDFTAEVTAKLVDKGFLSFEEVQEIFGVGGGFYRIGGR